MLLGLLQIKWGPDNLDGYLNFYPTSGDGRVSNWTLVKTALLCNDTLNIEFTKVLQNTGDDDIPEGLTGIFLVCGGFQNEEMYVR